MGGDPIQPIGERDRASARADDGGARHALDPFVATAGDVEEGILVGQAEYLEDQPMLPVEGGVCIHHDGKQRQRQVATAVNDDAP